MNNRNLKGHPTVCSLSQQPSSFAKPRSTSLTVIWSAVSNKFSAKRKRENNGHKIELFRLKNNKSTHMDQQVFFSITNKLVCRKPRNTLISTNCILHMSYIQCTMIYSLSWKLFQKHLSYLLVEVPTSSQLILDQKYLTKVSN